VSVSQFDTTTITTPAGAHEVTIALTQGADRFHTFDIEVCYSPTDVAVLTMQINTLATALSNPGLLVDEGRMTALVDGGVVALYLPMHAGYALLQLPMSAVEAFVATAQASMSTKWNVAISADIATERAVTALAEEGITALDAWLANQS